MKVRIDYVSNSSSASFLIVLPKEIEKYERDEFVNLFKTKDETYGEDEGYDYSVGKNSGYFYDLFDGDDTYWGTPFKLNDGKYMYNLSISDHHVELYEALMMEAKANKKLIPYWKYDS